MWIDVISASGICCCCVIISFVIATGASLLHLTAVCWLHVGYYCVSDVCPVSPCSSLSCSGSFYPSVNVSLEMLFTHFIIVCLSFRLTGRLLSVRVSLGTVGFLSLCLCIAPTGRLATRLTAPTLQRPRQHPERPSAKTAEKTRGKIKRRMWVMRRPGGERARRGGRSMRPPSHRLPRSLSQRPPSQRNHTPRRITGARESESRPLTPSRAPSPPHLFYPTAERLTGAPSPRRLLRPPLSHTPTHPPSLQPSPPLCTAPAPCTETGSSTRASAPRRRTPATSTRCSIPTAHTWGGRRAGTDREELLRSTDARGRRRSTTGASRR